MGKGREEAGRQRMRLEEIRRKHAETLEESGVAAKAREMIINKMMSEGDDPRSFYDGVMEGSQPMVMLGWGIYYEGIVSHAYRDYFIGFHKVIHGGAIYLKGVTVGREVTNPKEEPGNVAIDARITKGFNDTDFDVVKRLVDELEQKKESGELSYLNTNLADIFHPGLVPPGPSRAQFN